MKRLFVMLFASVAVACSDQSAPPPPPQTAQTAPAVAAAPGQPVIVNNQPAADSGMKDMLLGGALGYMLGSSGNRNAAPGPAAAPSTYIIERRYYVRERAAPTPAPAAQPAAPAPAPVAAAEPPKTVQVTPPAAKPFAYGSPPAPTPKVTYGTGFSQVKAAPAPVPRPSTPTYTSRSGSYSPRR
ncbi:hypothetical protein [Cupriavidus sp. IK-TO18]|uniref:hypothetical protein n=1 Tax=Cupriavidus sp. IK-TO18 TaxID=2782182 RepID=UPI001899EECE|nr:hypothetical protein [Cupriavidus sp. IK-TO18]MBF6987235.1 hypothetical protein [Cupriavidus sp. IK-TO18]